MVQSSVSFPEGAVTCAAGDYLVCGASGERWQVYKVEDLLLIKRLLPVQYDPSALMIEEHLLDSRLPAYFDEVQLLLTDYGSDFVHESEAFKAIELQTLTEVTKGLLRPAGEFPESDCRVVHQAPGSTPML